MGGYSEDAVTAVQLGKSLSVVLFDRADVEAIAAGEPFERVLRHKLYAAGRTGEIYIPWPKLKQAREAAKLATEEQERSPSTTAFVLTEDAADAIALKAMLSSSLGRSAVRAPKVEFVPVGHGGWLAHSTARSMAKLLATSTPGPGSIAIVLGPDRDDPLRDERLRATYEQSFRTLPPDWRARLFVIRSPVAQWTEAEQQQLSGFIIGAGNGPA